MDVIARNDRALTVSFLLAAFAMHVGQGVAENRHPDLFIYRAGAAIGLAVYFLYSRNRSHVGRGIIDVHEDDPDAPGNPVPPVPSFKDDNKD